jgi:hypothetical protein
MAYTVTIQPVSITMAGEWQFFNLRLTADTVRIVGIETGFILESPLQSEPEQIPFENWLFIQRPQVMGHLKLQTAAATGVFYETDITDHYRGAHIAEWDYSWQYYGETILFPGTTAETHIQDYNSPFHYWKPLAPTHAGIAGIEPIEIPLDTQIIEGRYRDYYGRMYNQDMKYKVFLYIWCEVNETTASNINLTV